MIDTRNGLRGRANQREKQQHAVEQTPSPIGGGGENILCAKDRARGGTYNRRMSRGGVFFIPKESQLKGEERKWRKKEGEEEERRNIYHSSL
jgi:hypothetical protein